LKTVTPTCSFLTPLVVQAEAERELGDQVAKNDALMQRIAALQADAEMQAGLHVESYADLKEMFKKLVVERNETNKRQGQAMLEAQVFKSVQIFIHILLFVLLLSLNRIAIIIIIIITFLFFFRVLHQMALEHLMHDKTELLAEVDSLYNQLAATSGRQTRAAQAAAKEADNLRSVRQMAKKKEAALAEECRQLREALAAERASNVRQASEGAQGLERFRSETTAKIKLLEESLRLQDEVDKSIHTHTQTVQGCFVVVGAFPCLEMRWFGFMGADHTH
jgi:hypothetical protein